MNLQNKLKFGLLALAIGLMVGAVPAHAQQLYRASFELPFESQWGDTVVEPGHYTITIEQGSGSKLIRLHGSVELAMFAGLSNPEPYADTSKLTFVNVNGLYTLKAFKAGEIGKDFVFPVHAVKGERAQVTTVAVSAN
jgi:hypothetical protein